MKFRDTGSDVSFEPCPIGNHIARCVNIVDLGTHHEEMYSKDKHQVFIMWEIPNEMKTFTKKGENGAPDQEVTEPFTASKWYNMTLAEGSHLRTDLESWRSRAFTDEELEGFDPKNVIGKPCMINVIHKPKKKGGINALVTAVTPMPKGIECAPQHHKSVYFSLDPEDFTEESIENVSSGLQKIVRASQEWQQFEAARGGAPVNPPAQSENSVPEGFDDIPF